MDNNIDLNDIMNSIEGIGERNAFSNEILSPNTLNGSNELDTNEDIDCNEIIEEMNTNTSINDEEMSLGLVADREDREVTQSDISCQLLTDTRMETKTTPSLQLKQNISKKRNLFGIENRKQLFVNNICNYKTKDNYFDNSLGLSPVKKEFIRGSQLSFAVNKSVPSLTAVENNENNEFNWDLNSIQFNSFESNDKPFGNELKLSDESFKSLNNCSDLDLKTKEQAIDVNQTYRSPNSEFDGKTINNYFKQYSEPLSSIESFGNSFDVKTKSTDNSIKTESYLSLMNESFASVCNEINSSDNTLQIVQKIIERKNRKRKSIFKNSLTPSECHSFTPSTNSTFNLGVESASAVALNDKSVVTSGLGTLTTVGAQTYSMPNSNINKSIGLSNANTLNLNQLLSVSPNVLTLTIGCFVTFRLNYLKVKNLSITSFKAEIKVHSNVDVLNNLDIKYPKQVISIPAFFDGLLSDQITITPLNCGSYTLVFGIYLSIENINLPLNPLSIVCHIRSEEVVIKRPLFSTNSSQINYNLFENTIEYQTIDLCISNKHFFSEIPLKLSLEPNKCLMFEPLYRHPDSAIHTFRCLDPRTLFLVTKTQYQMRIPIRTHSSSVGSTEASLTVSTDSDRSHVLAIIRLKATFWPKNELTESLLQCSETSVCLLRGQWKRIEFRNKSDNSLIRVSLKCLRDKHLIKGFIKFSSNQLMIAPKGKDCIGLMVDEKTVLKTDSQYYICAQYDGGFGKSTSVLIAIAII